MIPQCYFNKCDNDADGGYILSYADVPDGFLDDKGNVVSCIKTIYCRIQICAKHRDLLIKET